MNKQPISFTGKLTLQDALDLHHYQSLCVVRRSIRWLIGVVSFFLTSIILIGSFKLGEFNPIFFVILILCAYFPVGWWYERRLMVRWQYRRHPEHFLENTVTISESSVSVSNANMDLRLNWNQLAFLLNTPKGLLFMLPQIRTLWWLPQRLFEGNDYRQSIINFAMENKVPVRSMT